MNIADVLLIVLLLAGIRLGTHIGIVRQFAITVGIVLGTTAAAMVQNYLAGLAQARSDELFFWFLLLLSILIVGLFFDFGWVAGKILHKKIQVSKTFSIVDIAAGGLVAGVTSIAVLLLWSTLVIQSPNVAFAYQIKNSVVMNSLRQTFPRLPGLFVQAANLLDPHALPQVFAGSEPRANKPTLPDDAFVADVSARVADSVVKVSGVGCGGTVTGTGFVVGQSLIMTNAHVIAGLGGPRVTDSAGEHVARTVLYDPKLDIAILAVDGLKGKPLPLDDTFAGQGTPGVTLGYATGVLRAHAASVAERLSASGYDIYNQSPTVRSVYMLHDTIEHGDSGGPFVTQQGAVAGMVFGKSTDSDNVGYALTADQLVGKLQSVSASSRIVTTGACGVE